MPSISDDHHQGNVVDLNSRRDAAPGGRHDGKPVFDGDVLAAQHTTKRRAEHGPTTALKEVLDHFSERDDMPSQNEVIIYTTTTYLRHIDPSGPPTPGEVEKHLLTIVKGVARQENTKTKVATEKLPTLRTLTDWQVAQILLHLHHVVRIVFSGSKKLGALATYATSGEDMGTYVVDEDELRRLARGYNAQLSLRQFAEVMAVLKEDAPRVAPCQDPDLIGVNNGIFDYRTKELRPFDPSIILMAKVRVDYVVAPDNPVIVRDDGSTWDVESWMNALSDDPERVNLGWHGLGAAVRPNVAWNKALLLFHENGNNGKGTYMALCKRLVGADSWGALSIADFEDKFRLPEIVNKTAFGADENNVGAFTEKMANFKATITNDAVMIERKHQDPYWYEPRGFMVQCLNSLPKSKDVSQSYYRRLLFWKFDKSFEGREDKAIKADYLQRREVLEYVLWKVLNLPDYYELPEPESSKAVLAEFKKSNDPVREFWDDVEEELVWGLLPQQFLHDLFIAWSSRTNPRGGGLKKLEFYNRLRQLVAEDGRWEDGQWGTSTLMSAPEPLIAEHDLRAWMNPHYSGPDPLKKSQPEKKPKYRGLRRISGTTSAASATDDPTS